MSLETTTPSAAASTTPLTIDQHVELMTKPVAAPRKAKAPAPEPEAEITEDTSETDAADDAGEVVDAEDTEATPQVDEGAEDEPTEANVEGDEEGDTDEPALPAIDPPKFWDAEGKESFAKLSPEAQRQVLKYEEQRTKAVAKAMQESAEVRKHSEAKLRQLQDVSERIGEYVDSAKSELTEWQGSIREWNDWFASDAAIELFEENPAQYRQHEAEFLRIKATFQHKVSAYQKAMADKSLAETQAFSAFRDEQERVMPELVPELADPKEGQARRQELFTYLTARGFEPQRINEISAQEAQLAWKAKQYDDLGDVKALARDAALYRKASAYANRPPNPKPKLQAGPSAPATGQGQRLSSSEARFKTLNSKPSISSAEHTELLLLKAKLRK